MHVNDYEEVQRTRRILICTRCEKELTEALTQAFNRGGYKVDIEYCEEHEL